MALTSRLIIPTTTIPTFQLIVFPEASANVCPPKIALMAKNPNIVTQLQAAGSSAGQ